MACVFDCGPGESKMQDESIQLLASKLPEGDSLPDGFSEGFTEISSEANLMVTSLKRISGHESDVFGDEMIGSKEMKSDGPNAPTPSSEECQSMHQMMDPSLGNQTYSSDSNDISIVLREGHLSPCSSHSEVSEKREKPRRFPVQLSEKEYTISFKDEPVESSDEHNIILDKNNGGLGCKIDSSPDENMSLTAGLSRTSLHNEHELHLKDLKTGDLDSHPCDIFDREARTKDLEVEEKEGMDVKVGHPMTSLVMESDLPDQVSVGTIHAGDILGKKVLALQHECEQLRKKRDSADAESAKNLLLREKLESLCRELQRQNKQITDECKRIASEEQQKRLDLSSRFQSAIKDVTVKLEEQGNERLRQIKENEMLREKLNHFIHQYEICEQQHAQQFKSKSLELQLSEVKLKQQEELVKQEQSKNQVCKDQIAQLLRNDQDLRAQLSLYGSKFEQFQDTLAKSNEVFASYKKEMEKMSTTIKVLEKENLLLKKKCKEYELSLIELVDEKEILKKQFETTRNQKEKLESLCRSLQADRKLQKIPIAGTSATVEFSAAVNLNLEQPSQDQ
eukprot:c24377_g1_i1 orf=275-1969(-)